MDPSNDQHLRSRDATSAAADTTATSLQPDSWHLQAQNGVQVDEGDELSSIRALLRPPAIPGLPDWGIPPNKIGPYDQALEV